MRARLTIRLKVAASTEHIENVSSLSINFKRNKIFNRFERNVENFWTKEITIDSNIWNLTCELLKTWPLENRRESIFIFKHILNRFIHDLSRIVACGLKSIINKNAVSSLCSWRIKFEWIQCVNDRKDIYSLKSRTRLNLNSDINLILKRSQIKNTRLLLINA